MVPPQAGPTMSSPIATGLKFVTITLGRATRRRHFIHPPVAGPKVAVERIRPDPSARRDQRGGSAGLRAAIEALPCCGANEDSAGKADPLNLVIVGDSLSVVFRWSSAAGASCEISICAARRSATEDFFLDGNDPGCRSARCGCWPGARMPRSRSRAINDQPAQPSAALADALALSRGQSVFVGQISRDIGIEHTDGSGI